MIWMEEGFNPVLSRYALGTCNFLYHGSEKEGPGFIKVRVIVNRWCLAIYNEALTERQTSSSKKIIVGPLFSLTAYSLPPPYVELFVIDTYSSTSPNLPEDIATPKEPLPTYLGQ